MTTLGTAAVGSLDIWARRNDAEHGEMAAAGRIDWARNLVDRRTEALAELRQQQMRIGGDLMVPPWKQGPAFEVHIRSGLADLLAVEECRRNLRRIVAAGVATHVVVFLWEPLNEVAAVLTKWSGFLAAELVVGHALRHISKRGGS